MNDTDIQGSFLAVQSRLQDAELPVIKDVISDHWIHGRVSSAALVSAAALPRIVIPESIWPFLDMAELSVARWYLASIQLRSRVFDSEIWFSWALAEESWTDLMHAARRAPERSTRAHMSRIVSSVESCRTFSEFEETYDYGLMITPWNHFHLTWVALRLRDQASALAHAETLCTLAANADIRASRFIIRVLNWTVFQPIVADSRLKERLDLLCFHFEQRRPAHGSALLDSDVRVSQTSFRRTLESLWTLTRR